MGKRNNLKRRVRSKEKGLDEDYVISDEDESEGDDLNEDSFDGCAVEEDEVEVEEEEVVLRSVEWPKVKTGPRGNRKITGCRSRKVEQVVVVVSDKEEDEDLDDAEEDERESVKEIGFGKRRRVFYEVEDEDGDYPEEEDVSCEKEEMALEEQENVSQEKEKEDDGDYDEDEDGDEEFSADEEDVSLDEKDEEEETLKVCKRNKRKQRSRGGGRKRRNVASGRKRRGKNAKEGVDDDDDDDGDFVDDCLPARKRARSLRPRRRCTLQSDSDIASSGESDYEYTISEEEREQVREVSSLLRSNVKHVSSTRKATVHPQLRKSPVKKSEKKVEIVMKNVCGICLSKEDMRRLKGTLDCCTHYFCFTCIMEWSKVESRCPLCKQRFRTISKPARSTHGVDLREVVIRVPERDQVYQPTEEELRSYLDPYENIICSECHQGEDDGLMLLCDLCDSSAHTYCVGLGREVPEGNWYCDACRPVALGTAISQMHATSEPQRVTGFYSRPSPLVVSGQYQDPSSLVSPRTPFSSGDYLFSSRNGDVQGSSPFGLGATTLSRRRTLHRHIQNIINSDRLVNMGSSRTGGSSMIANSSDGREREPPQHVATLETGMSLYTISEERLHNEPELLSPKLDHFGSDEAARRFSSNTFRGDRPIDLELHYGLAQGDPLFGNQQHPRSYMPNTMSLTGGERLQQRVKAHLQNLSRQINLGTHNPIPSSSSWFNQSLIIFSH